MSFQDNANSVDNDHIGDIDKNYDDKERSDYNNNYGDLGISVSWVHLGNRKINFEPALFWSIYLSFQLFH